MQGHEAGHSPPSSSKAKKTWIYTSTPTYIFMAWCLVKHRNSFTITLPFMYDIEHVHVKVYQVCRFIAVFHITASIIFTGEYFTILDMHV
jgi:hypothetical protein